MHSRNLTVAVLHLVLLGIVTPGFLLGVAAGLCGAPGARRRSLRVLGVMVGALAADGVAVGRAPGGGYRRDLQCAVRTGLRGRRARGRGAAVLVA
jgi:hypothetical protein